MWRGRLKKGRVMVMGDFNARVGKEIGSNGEETVNSDGNKLIGLVGRKGMVAANLGDNCIGKWTRILEYGDCEKERQQSIIDYILVEKDEEEGIVYP